MGWIRCVRCEKFRCDFVEKTFALIALVQPILHRVLCSNETLQNTPNHYETHTNMSLGSNGVGRVHSLRKIAKRLHGTNLCINCTYSNHLHQIRVEMKHCQRHPNTTRRTKTWVYGPMGWIGSVHYTKFRCDFLARSCAIFHQLNPFAPSFV